MNEGLRLQIAHLRVCKTKYGNRTRNNEMLLSLYLLISSIQGCLLSLQLLSGIKPTKWYNGYCPHGVHGAKP